MPGKSAKGERDEEPNWIVVAKVAGVVQAQMMAERLKSLGIPAVAHYESIASIYGLTLGGLGEARILVPESFLIHAQRALESGEVFEDTDDFQDDDELDEFGDDEFDE